MTTLQIGQYIPSGNSLAHVEVGLASFDNSTLEILEENKLWPYGVPTDGTPRVNIVTVSLGNIVCFTLLGVIGIFYALAYMLFNYINRHKKVIRLSSPNLNYLIGIGAIILYINIITLTIRHSTEESLAVVYNMNPWLTNIGYSLCYGTISSKMIRVWYIFNNPVLRKKFTLKDHHLGLIVGVFVVVDVVMLGTYTIVEGARGNLRAVLIRSAENPERRIGEVHHYYYYGTSSTGQLIWFAILSFEKAVVHVIVLYLALRTRKVKMKGLGDSKFIIAATYSTSIVLVMSHIGIYSLYKGFLNIFIATVAGNFFISTTTILSIVFIPKILILWKDPTGKGSSSYFTRTIGGALESADAADREREKMVLQREIEQLETQLQSGVCTEAAAVRAENAADEDKANHAPSS
ncbi:Gamma-aminobutyric acid type B receptor subunit 2 [Geodia barretti]|uniref:Gamma-aminobutyric acid type B receptor subunit 2 n=1 Tax=Geodia barretti TaxID=519541 RepID=A0AA35RL84_GEOBA|nr:Gamma-aminobutyric acid type B receptor subunit 2 [Geodia barretti]